ncbi:MAG: hypothetical protein KAG19_06670 [Methylococcales bacterium]|nr:hypothetical protein [Methylococcales bacterium]
MANFSTLWTNHAGRAYVCDPSIFGNQCAMRMGQALEDSGIDLTNTSLRRCQHYSTRFKHHKPGHIRSAQELANVFYRKPHLLGRGVKKRIFSGCINDHLSEFKDKTGLLFIMNGWGSTDHIDLWNGITMRMRASANTADYQTKGRQVWFWEID